MRNPEKELIELLLKQKAEWEANLDSRIFHSERCFTLYDWIGRALAPVIDKNLVKITIDQGVSELELGYSGPSMTLEFDSYNKIRAWLINSNTLETRVAISGRFAWYTLVYACDKWFERDSGDELTQDILEKLIISMLIDTIDNES